MSDLYYAGRYEDTGDEDIWDDRKLNDAYDKALKIANAEVAKRVAMSTNSDHKPKEIAGPSDFKKEKQSKKSKSKKETNTQWKAGMPCRAIYETDGQEYEAFILRIINNKECIVRFLGYENSEIVSVSSLRPSRGEEERNLQIGQALDDKNDNMFACQSPSYAERAPSPGSTEKSFVKTKKAAKKKKHSFKMQNFDLPEMPFSMPNISALRNMGTMDMPPPPPPAAGEGEEQALSSMLLSWYMSGYYTGLYQGMKRARENRRDV